jgi:ribosomal protein S18 acetylase RimI-like enzyme
MEIISYRKADTALYEQTLALRNEILRQPLGFSIYDEDLSYESENIFFGAFEKDQLVGTLNYYVPEVGTAQLCAFAVRADRQKQGIGRQLVEMLLKDLQRQGFKKCIVEARELALGFYEKVDFVADRPLENLRLGINDWMMHKDLK